MLALAQLPHQGVFATTGTDHQDFHSAQLHY
jgi:hypothetical protein